MTTEQIQTIIHEHYGTEDIHSLHIEINEHNKQVETIKIIFKPAVNVFFDQVGKVLEDIDSLTREDEYGDMTGAKFEFTSYEEIENDEQTCSLTFNIEIDS